MSGVADPSRDVGVILARMDDHELADAPYRSGALLLGLKARDAYLDLEALPHDHQLGQD